MDELATATSHSTYLRGARAGKLKLGGLPGYAAAVCLCIHCAACDRSAHPTPATMPAAPPQRIISISPNATEIIGALGETRRLAAVSTFCLWPPEVKQLPRIGGLFDANVELILKLHPDLIVLRGNQAAVERLAQERGIRLYRDKTERLQDIYQTLDEMAALLGCPDQARDVSTRMRTRLERIAASVAGLPRPRVLLSLARRPDTLGDIMTGNERTFVHDIIVAAGGENVFAHASMDYPRLSAEGILAAQPEVIIEAMPEVPEGKSLEPSIRSQWQRLGPMPAVRSGRIHIMTDDNCLIPSPRIVEIIAKVARLLHPEAAID